MATLIDISGNFFWLNILLAISVVFFGRKDPRSTIFWVMVLTFIPIGGFALYLLFGQNFNKDKMFRLKERGDKRIKDYIHFQEKDIGAGGFTFQNWRSQDYQDLIQMNLNSDEAFYTEDNEVEIFYDGQEKFDRMFEDIDNATHSIDVQYYQYRRDKIGLELIKRLTKKAKEGIEVRFLVDGIGGREIRRRELAEFHEAGGKSAVFFPSILPYVNFRINYRNHRKLVIVDDHIGYIGGFNVGDEYLGKDKKIGAWRDTHLRIMGFGCAGMKIRFIKDWTYASKEDWEDVEETLYMPNHEFTGETALQIVTSGPDTQLDNVKNAILRMISSAKKHIYIQTPYFVPDQSVYDALVTAIASGVDVHIMIPKYRDHPFVHWASLSFMGELLKIGCHCYIYEKGFMHSKVVVVDDYVSTVGSTNMDIRSFSLNFEANAILYDQKVNDKLINQFMVDVFYSDELRYEEYLNRSKWVKVKESFSRLLAPIL